jgi:hypothetical protein
MLTRKILPLFLAISAGALLAQDHPTRVVVTVEASKDATPPSLNKEDILVSVDNNRMRVTDWTPIQSYPAGVELWLLIDDGADSSLGTEFEELHNFVLQQPATTKVGIGYLRNGSVDVLQKPTADHAAAAKAIRLPLAQPGASASPYLALIDLIQKWPAGDQAREVVMISSGVDPDNGPGPSNLYLDRSITTAERAGVVVNAIYFPSAGHFGHSRWQINWGQNYLSQLTEETGGEFFWLGDSSPVSFAPYFKELNQHFRNQYLLTFVAQGNSGSHRLKIKTEIPRVMLVGPAKVNLRD